MISGLVTTSSYYYTSYYIAPYRMQLLKMVCMFGLQELFNTTSLLTGRMYSGVIIVNDLNMRSRIVFLMAFMRN